MTQDEENMIEERLRSFNTKLTLTHTQKQNTTKTNYLLLHFFSSNLCNVTKYLILCNRRKRINVKEEKSHLHKSRVHGQ